MIGVNEGIQFCESMAKNKMYTSANYFDASERCPQDMVNDFLASSINFAKEGHQYQRIANWLKELNELRESAIIMDWISVNDELPPNETTVLVTCEYPNVGRKFVSTAFYTDGTVTTEDSWYVWHDIDNWEYIEDKDDYVIPEGWWESVDFGEDFYAIDARVLAWMPLPKPWANAYTQKEVIDNIKTVPYKGE